ncbi:hypothetical protein [Haloechinothrix salitolerans]|uniref:Uncharacterized protein n=1 Tax=Haloechinothrix salitolerans TaxID=926830 RepID=A0ABW2BSP6_9PSEU
MIEPADDHDRDMPDDPQTRPDDAVDALEERVFGERAEQRRDEDDTEEPAFRHDIDTQDPESPNAGPDEPTE